MGKDDRKQPERGKAAANAGMSVGSVGMIGWLGDAFGRGGSLEWIKSLLIAIGLALIIRWVFAEPFRIPSGSMEPTLHGDEAMFHGDRVFVNKWVYGLRFPLNDCRVPFTMKRLQYASNRIWRRADPQRFDIVVFKSVEEGAIHTTLVKRLIGLPGERIHIADGKIHVNGTPLEMPPELRNVYYTSPSGSFSDMKYGILQEDQYSVVPKDCYLLLGDNSAHSRDGRYFGWVPNENILGRVSCIWWPVPRWRDFTGFSATWWWRGIVVVISLLLVLRIFFGRSWHIHRRTSKGKLRVDHFYVNRWAFGIPIPFMRTRLRKGRDPKRGELVMYRRTAKEKGEPDLLLGRVAGLSGERVFFDSGKLTVDGQRLSAPDALAQREFEFVEGMGNYGRSKGKEQSLVPQGHFFILTESALAEEHYDSRTFGWVAHEDLIGSATLVWWPPSRWRRSQPKG